MVTAENLCCITWFMSIVKRIYMSDTKFFLNPFWNTTRHIRIVAVAVQKQLFPKVKICKFARCTEIVGLILKERKLLLFELFRRRTGADLVLYIYPLKYYQQLCQKLTAAKMNCLLCASRPDIWNRYLSNADWFWCPQKENMETYTVHIPFLCAIRRRVISQ